MNATDISVIKDEYEALGYDFNFHNLLASNCFNALSTYYNEKHNNTFPLNSYEEFVNISELTLRSYKNIAEFTSISDEATGIRLVYIFGKYTDQTLNNIPETAEGKNIVFLSYSFLYGFDGCVYIKNIEGVNLPPPDVKGKLESYNPSIIVSNNLFFEVIDTSTLIEVDTSKVIRKNIVWIHPMNNSKSYDVYRNIASTNLFKNRYFKESITNPSAFDNSIYSIIKNIRIRDLNNNTLGIINRYEEYKIQYQSEQRNKMILTSIIILAIIVVLVLSRVKHS